MSDAEIGSEKTKLYYGWVVIACRLYQRRISPAVTSYNYYF